MRINFAQFPIYDGIKKEKLIENLERASRINDELAKLKLAKETLNNGGYVRIYSSARSSAGCVELDIANFNGEVSTCIDNHIAELESEIETL